MLEELKKKSGLKTNAINANVADSIGADSERIALDTTADLLKLLTAKKQPLLMYAIKNDISFKAFENGKMHIAVSDKADKNLIHDLREFLEKETGIKWQIDIDYEPLGETLAFIESKELNQNKKNISEYPLVRAILNEFNGATIETIIRKSVQEAADEEPAEFDGENNLTETQEDED